MEGLMQNKMKVMDWRRFLVLPLMIAAAFYINLPCSAVAEDSLTISASAQIYEVFEGSGLLDDFKKQTGIDVKLTVTNSTTAQKHLADGICDVAVFVENASQSIGDGFTKVQFARDAIAVVTNPKTRVENLDLQQLQSIFKGEISNWKDVGGEDIEIIRVIPAPETALNANFSKFVMNGGGLSFDVLTTKSTFAYEVARRFQGGISFVNQGATHGKPAGAKLIKVNGLKPVEEGYPFQQIFSVSVKGEPAGAVKQFLDYLFSEKTGEIIKTVGLIPIPRQ